MPTPNKYHSSGFLYGTMGYERGESVRGYIWTGSTPRNFGHNADKRVRREQAKYWRSLHGRGSITKGGGRILAVDESNRI